MLAEGYTKKQTAVAVGVSAHTISQWCKERAFNDAVNAMLCALDTESMKRFSALRQQAVQTLSDLLRTGPASSRLGAARLILESAPAPEKLVQGKEINEMFDRTIQMLLEP